MDRDKLIAVIASLAVVFLFSFLTKGGDNTEMKTVTRVIDGDTVVLEGGERVRLLGMDTQEEGEPCYEASKERLEELVLKEEVRIEGNKKDQYGRTLAYIFHNGTLINEQLVREGLAVAYFYEEGSKYRDEIQNAERSAMEESRGCEWSS